MRHGHSVGKRKGAGAEKAYDDLLILQRECKRLSGLSEIQLVCRLRALRVRGCH